MTRFENKVLNNAVKAFREQGTQETSDKMLFALLTGHLLVSATWDKEPKQNEQGDMVFDPETKFNVLTIETTEKKRYFPMFTSQEEIEKWPDAQKASSLAITFDQFMPWVELAKGEVFGIVIDPFGANVSMNTDFLLALKNRPKPNLEEKQIKKGEPVSLREPVQDVTDLKETLCAFAKQESSIQSIYLKERVVKDKPSHWFLVVDMAPEDPMILQTMGQSCRSVNHGKEFEFIFASMKLAQDIMANSKPVYVKE